MSGQETRSYYGRPILKEPAWKVPDVPGYLFLGGLAGASASAAALSDLTGRVDGCRKNRLVAAGAAVTGVGALVHDLGRPERFLYMLRVFKPTSPLSVGSWILAPFGGLATTAAVAELAGWSRIGRLAGIGAGALGPAMCTYTAVLLADTAIPAWHAAYRELPLVFAGSALTSAAGVGLVAGDSAGRRPARRMGWLGAGMELAASGLMDRRHGLVGEPYRTGRARKLLHTAAGLTVLGTGLSIVGRRSRVVSGMAGAAYLAAGLCTRFGVFDAGVRSARDPKYVVTPQRERLARQPNR